MPIPVLSTTRTILVFPTFIRCVAVWVLLNRKTFCYLAPPRSALTPEARRRLRGFGDLLRLGSRGFSLAMQDTRYPWRPAASSALSKSGFMEDLGYETYQKILQQNSSRAKNDEFADLYAEDIKRRQEVSGDRFVELRRRATSRCSIPTPNNTSSERMLLYRELDNIERDEDLKGKLSSAVRPLRPKCRMRR